MKVLHLAASLPVAAIPQPRINPLRVEQNDAPLFDSEITDREEQEKFIKNEFEPFFKKFSVLFNLTEKAYTVLEEKENYSSGSVRDLGNALESLENVCPANVKKAIDYMNYALAKMPDDLVEEIFMEVCENPHLVLNSDELF